MTETPDERFDRLAESMESRVGAGYGRGGLTALLEELRRGDDGDKALADMLEHGVIEHVQRNAEGVTYLPPVRTYSPTTRSRIEVETPYERYVRVLREMLP